MHTRQGVAAPAQLKNNAVEQVRGRRQDWTEPQSRLGNRIELLVLVGAGLWRWWRDGAK